MSAMHGAAAGGGFAAGRRGRRRLPRWRELELDEEYAARGKICFICNQVMTKWVQVGSGWASGFYAQCRNCGEFGFKSAHNTCVPSGFKDGLIGVIARYLNKNIRVIDGTRRLMVDQCACCQGTDYLWILNRAWYDVVEVIKTKTLTPTQIDVALGHTHWMVREACVLHQLLNEEQIKRALNDIHPAVVRAAVSQKAMTT